jgi:hypothetical protein
LWTEALPCWVPTPPLISGQNLMLVDARSLQEFRAFTGDRGLITHC